LSVEKSASLNNAPTGNEFKGKRPASFSFGKAELDAAVIEQAGRGKGASVGKQETRQVKVSCAEGVAVLVPHGVMPGVYQSGWAKSGS